MRSFGRSTLMVAAVALAVTTAAIARGPTTVSQDYTVASDTKPGVTTGVVLGNGESVTVTATGTVCAGLACVGPGGNPAWNTMVSSYGGFVLPGAPAWGLVGRVGSGSWVQVGSGPTTLSGTGAVQFAVNDDLFWDNEGSFAVTLSYACWPGWGYGDKNHRHCGPPGLASAPGLPAGGRAPNGRAAGGTSSQAGSVHDPNEHASPNAGSAREPNEHASPNAGSNANAGQGPKSH
jgi:hypothetical protein